MAKIKTLTIRFSNELERHEITQFRGAVIAAVGRDDNVLFHNHQGDGYRYAYPMIQYKSIDHHATIVGIGNGADSLMRLISIGDINVNIGERNVNLQIESTDIQRTDICFLTSSKTYAISRWLPLNQENYLSYTQCDNIIGRVEMLQRMLIGNIISMAKGLDIHLDETVKIELKEVRERKYVIFKHQKMMTFDAIFTTNISLPNNIGLGKGTSLGFGILNEKTIKSIYSMEEKQNYLYGAEVQGIQSFIFQTNELKDIVGASELVEQICTKEFDEFAVNGDYILKAAGKIKFVFYKEENCRKAVLEFPRKVMSKAPGITISQAVVTYAKDGDEDTFRKAVDALEDKLKAQRNKPMNSITMGLIGVKRAPKTGMPGVCFHDKILVDEATVAKNNLTDNVKENKVRKLCSKSFAIDFENLPDKRLAYNIEDITDKNDWIAIIHADGNGLGQVVQKVGKNKEKFREFSEGLDLSTKNAAHAAFEEVKSAFANKKIIPIRPVVWGGDDMTVICRADFAVKYAKTFIKAFEEETKINIGSIIRENNVFANKDYLTCCAGIAFIKSSYPFYYGYNLAESLCDRAKKDAKEAKRLDNNGGLAPSCLMFHKVQDSFIESFDDIVRRELIPQPGYSFEFGPYYIQEEKEKWTVDDLFNSIALFDSEKDKGNTVKTNLRQWMAVMHDDVSAARQRAKRVLSLMDKRTDGKLYNMFDKVTNANSDEKKFPVYDMLSLYTVIHQVTK